jgi:hypothetical protein
MITARSLVVLAAAAAIAACAEAQPPMSGTAAGPGARADEQLSRAAPGSAPVSQGTPVITGSRSTGEGNKPTVEYTGQGTGNVWSGNTQMPDPAMRSRSRP